MTLELLFFFFLEMAVLDSEVNQQIETNVDESQNVNLFSRKILSIIS